MLKFLTTGYPGSDFPAGETWKARSYTGLSSDIVQLIDLSAHESIIERGNTVLSASVWVNRVQGDESTDDLYKLSLWPFFGPFDDLTDTANTPDWDQLIYADLYSDSDPSTWEELRLEISLPSDTKFVRLGISAVEDISPETSYPELDGHYADFVSARVWVVPEPTTCAMLIGLAGIGLVVGWRACRNGIR
jgi:hypothetical protein